MVGPTPVAVVTGSSSGIGRAIAIAFAKFGYRVVIHGNRNLQGLAENKNEIASLFNKTNAASLAAKELGEVCQTVTADLSSQSGIESCFQTSLKAFGRIDAWVNAAGADVLTGAAKELPFEDKLDLLWSVDVRATMLLSRMAAQSMAAQSVASMKPSILTISWDQVEHGFAGDSGQYFGATKGAIAAFTKSLALSVGPRVRANCLAPGWIQTEWGGNAPQNWQNRAIGESCLGRWGKPEDVASAAVWLCSPAAEFINGQVLPINGGWKPNYDSRTDSEF